MKTALKIAAGVLFVLVASVAGLLYSVLKWPELIVNNQNLARAIDYLPRFGLELRSQSHDIGIESISLFTKRLRLSLESPCLKAESFRACFGVFETELTVTLYPFQVNAIHKLDALGGDIEISPLKEVTTEDSSSSNPLRMIERLSWESVNVVVDKFVYRLDGDALTIQAVVSGKGDSKGLTASATAAGRFEKNPLKLDATVRIDSGFPWLDSKWSSNVGVALRWPDMGMDVQLESTSEKMYPKFTLDWVMTRKKGPNARLQWIGEMDEDTIRGKVSGRFVMGKNAITLSEQDPCAVSIFFGGRYLLKCPTRIPINPDFVKVKTGIPVPDTVGAQLEADVLQPFPPDLSLPIKGEASARLLAVETKSFRAEGQANAKFDFLIEELPNFRALDSKIDFELNVHNFEQMAVDLSATEFAIPAPFHVLDGTIVAKVANGRVTPDGADLPFVWKTDLSSKTQVVKMSGQGRFALALKPKLAPKLEAEAILADVRLNLPRVEWLELSNPPQVVPDARIKAGFQQNKPSNFDYRIKVRSENPVQLMSNLAVTPIPIGINLDISKQDSVLGEIAVQKFPLMLFRRQAELSHLKINFNRKEAGDTIDGRAKVAYTDYTIYVIVSGPLDEPKVDVESSPPLPKRQLIATLVFGRPIAELDSDQKSSVANLEGALTDGVLSYYSLYYLASTPVESVGYDAASKRLTAKVRLQEGTSLNVGLNEDRGDVGAIGIRRRLGRGWVLRTEVEDPFERSARNVSTFLEWLFKY